MKAPHTVYRGERLYTNGVPVGVRVTVDGSILTPHRSRELLNRSDSFEWGYFGAAPNQLALALVLDATGDAMTALRVYRFVMIAQVGFWLRDRWTITAGGIFRLVDQADREEPLDEEQADEGDEPDFHEVPTVVDLSDRPIIGCVKVRRCRECACTDTNCEQCIRAHRLPVRLGHDAEPPLCTRCYADGIARSLAGAESQEGGAS